MDDAFLKNLMQAAKKVTHAERCMVVDQNLDVIMMINIDVEMIQSPEFGEFARECLQGALDSGAPVITNNVITDLSDAPITNTNFANLRVVVAMPVRKDGAIYLDQHIRNGIIPKEMIDRFMAVITHIVDQQLFTLETSEIVKLYQQQTAT